MNPPPTLDRFTVVATDTTPGVDTYPVRSPYVEDEWLPYLGPAALLFARRCDHALSSLTEGHQSIAVLVHRWAEALGVYPEEVVAARNRLLRFGLATWEPKGNIMGLDRHWPPVPAAIATPEHRPVLLGLSDMPLLVPEQVEP